MRKKRREFLETDLTSLIDVVFLLLIFFMATSVFKKEELKLSLTLPKAGEGQAVTQEIEQLKIGLTKESLSVNGKITPLEDLKSQVSSIEKKDIPVELRIDKDVEYQRIVDILNLLKGSGLYNLDLITEKTK